MAESGTLEQLESLDHCFVEIYEDARRRILAQQEGKALLVVYEDTLILYQGGKPAQEFPGLLPPTYLKMKTLGHMPLAIYSLLHDRIGRELSVEELSKISAYLSAIKNSAPALDTNAEVAAGLLPKQNKIYDDSVSFLETVVTHRRVSHDDLAAFARTVCEDIFPVLAAAARAQLDICQEHVNRIQNEILSKEQWNEMRVLILGPYMARRGEIFLQYFARLLHTPMQGDRRIVYFEGDDLKAAFDRLGTTMLDALASKAIFSDASRLHRDVLADETTRYLDKLLSHPA